jgi:hypothetical protein
MILTKNNQTPLDLALEFVNNVRNIPINPDLAKIGENYASMEDLPEVPERVIHQVEHAGANPNSKTNGREVEFLINTQAKVSDVLLSWICSQSDGNPSYINTVLGMYATVFYQYNTRDTVMTLKWLNAYVGPGKILDYRNIFPYFKVSLNNEGKSVYTIMTPDDLYLAG